MPLVTRTANQGNLFKQSTEPPDWLDGDLWSDTTANILNKNVGGTSTQVGLAETLTTKGDTQGFSTVPARIPIGANDTVLTADSVQTLGLKWAVPTTKLEVIEDFVTSASQSEKVFTFTAIDFDSVSHLILMADGAVSAATAIIGKINGLTVNYRTNGRSIGGGSETLINLGSQSFFTYLTALALTAVNHPFAIHTVISLPQAGLKRIGIFSKGLGAAVGVNQQLDGQQDDTTTSITSVSIKTSAGNFLNDSRFTLYKVAR